MRAEFPINLTRVFQLLISMDKFINLDILIELLVQQSKLYSQQNGRNFLTNAEKIKAFIIFSSVFQWQNQVSPEMLKIELFFFGKNVNYCYHVMTPTYFFDAKPFCLIDNNISKSAKSKKTKEFL